MPRSTLSGRLGVVAAALGAALIYALVMFTPVLISPPGPLQSLRTAFWHDQLGYLSIVANAAAGDVAPHEPMTVTGVNHYPRTYYVSLGAIAHLLEIEPVAAWNAVSMTLQLGAVVLLAVTMSVLSRRWWMGFLALLPFFTGTLSTFTTGSWNTPLESHATLWGPYGVMFSNNAETAGLSIIIMVLSALALVWARGARAGARVAVSLVSAAALGALSGFQTYSFLTGIYLLSAILAAVFLWRAHWGWWAASAAAMAGVLLLGPVAATQFGQLPTLVLGLSFAVPGLLRGVIRTRGMLALYATVTAVAAAAPIMWTVSGILSGDPFLTYRVASNVELGVVHRETLLASLPLALPLLLILLIALHRRDRIAASAVLGSAVCAMLLASNDLWGANAEPYRFWIDCLLLCGAVGALAASRLVGTTAERAGSTGSGSRTASSAVVASKPSTGAHSPAGRGVRVAIWTGALVCAALYATALSDAVRFATDPVMSATWNPETSREIAVEGAARTAAARSPGLIATDACVDPRTTKITAQAPMAYFYLGMAWPEHVEAVASLIGGRLEGEITGDAVAESGTAWLVSEEDCGQPVTLTGISVVDEQAFPYDSGTIVLRRLATP